jgi:2,3-bisphosphoglycerate-independent phosphoglycerate mutase
MGNSEVGHNILGAGRILPQGASLVEQAIGSGEIWNGAWSELVEFAKNAGGAIHLLGLLSDGNVHSSERHLHAVIQRCADENVERVFVHVLLDGRDVSPQSALDYLDRLESRLSVERRAGREYWIASGGGRMTITMDRYEADWGMVKRGWETHVQGVGEVFPSARAAVESLRGRSPRICDQDLGPFVIGDDGGLPRGRIRDGDAVLLFNFRGDRAIEIAEAFEAGEDFSAFSRGRVPQVFFAGMTLYDGDRGIPARRLITPPPVLGTLSELLTRSHVRQFACAETHKYGHVTYFWNGNRSSRFDPESEDYLEIKSDDAPFVAAPAMRSKETGESVIDAVARNEYAFIRANFAACDMVGHTGDLAAAIAAVEAVDRAVAGVASAVEAAHGTLVVTADHGNAEDMVQRDSQGVPVIGDDGRPIAKTSHTLNPVAFTVVDASRPKLGFRNDLPDAGLANVAATLLELLGFQPPADYECSLLDSRESR